MDERNNLNVGKYRRSRFWAVREGGPDGKLVCLCVYRRGAREVARRLAVREAVANPEPADREREKGAVR